MKWGYDPQRKNLKVGRGTFCTSYVWETRKLKVGEGHYKKKIERRGVNSEEKLKAWVGWGVKITQTQGGRFYFQNGPNQLLIISEKEEAIFNPNSKNHILLTVIRDICQPNTQCKCTVFLTCLLPKTLPKCKLNANVMILCCI